MANNKPPVVLFQGNFTSENPNQMTPADYYREFYAREDEKSADESTANQGATAPPKTTSKA